MLGPSATAQAGLILSPTAVVSNSIGEIAASVEIGNVIDQSGLSSGFVSGATDYATYIAAAPTHSRLGTDLFWLGPAATGNIVFDLGSAYSIERLAIWQGGPSHKSAFNINSIKLETSADLAFTNPSAAGNFNVPRGLGGSVWPVNDFDLNDSVGRYVRLTIESNHGGFRSRFGEIAFDVSAVAVPEPSSFALLAAAGIAFVGKRLCRRRLTV